MYFMIHVFIPGHQKCCWTFLNVLSLPRWPAMGPLCACPTIALLTSFTLGTMVLPWMVLATRTWLGGKMVIFLLSSSLWSVSGGQDSASAAVFVFPGLYS